VLTLDGRRPAGAFARQPSDFYPTAEPLAEPLPGLEDLGPTIWECACGDGRLARVLAAGGVSVVATDLLAWGYGRPAVDFLRTRRRLAPVIVTNPPFSLWREFAEHAISLRPRLVVFLGRTLLQEGAGIGRLFDRHLVRVWQSRRRANMLPGDRQAEQIDKGHNTKLAMAWYVMVPDKPAELGDGWTTRGFMPRLVPRSSRSVAALR
jgi:hypothetical protein